MKTYTIFSALFVSFTLSACATGPVNDRALLVHASTGNIEAAQEMLDSGIDLGVVDVESGNGLLAYAAANGHNEFIVFLLDNGLDVNHRNYSGITPLMLAVSAGNYEGIEILADAGADLELRNYAPGFTAYMLADSNGDPVAMKLLQELGASVCPGCRVHSDL